MSPEAVSNSTCLITLERIGQLALLSRVFPTVYAPPAVHKEVGITIPWLKTKAVTNSTTAAVLKTQLGDGEAHAIAVALETPGAEIILDDKKARRVASSWGFA